MDETRDEALRTALRGGDGQHWAHHSISAVHKHLDLWT